nr:ribonuclease H-like domain-containing protein [Tanacetum cinerariifolium]
MMKGDSLGIDAGIEAISLEFLAEGIKEVENIFAQQKALFEEQNLYKVHLLTDDELTEKELKQIKADDQAIQAILLDLLEDIYATIDSCETAQEIWLRVQQMMKGSDIG